MVSIRLGWGSLLIASILAIGYLVMFVTVLMGSSDNENSKLMRDEIVDLQMRLDMASKIAPPVIKAPAPIVSAENKATRPGVIVLGMHRSGTSVVGGLMNKMGLNTGGPLIEAGADNEKGFFERVDVVLQNDALFRRQEIYYAGNTYKYNALQGLKDILNSKDTSNKFFSEGRRGLEFLNDPINYPWMLKDPRLCITIRTWLPLLDFVPAVLFIYRHPFDVTLSMHNRETEHFKMGKAMKLWYVYNRRAIQQSSDLCRVVGSHKKIMASPQSEFDRIYTELRSCGVPVPHKLTPAAISDFIDIKLQHGRNGAGDVLCAGDLSTMDPPAAWKMEEEDHTELYRESMRAFCAMEDGTAFGKNFVWDETISDDY